LGFYKKNNFLENKKIEILIFYFIKGKKEKEVKEIKIIMELKNEDCIICYEKTNNKYIHNKCIVPICSNCLEKLDKCPFCRKNIKNKNNNNYKYNLIIIIIIFYLIILLLINYLVLVIINIYLIKKILIILNNITFISQYLHIINQYIIIITHNINIISQTINIIIQNQIQNINI